MKTKHISLVGADQVRVYNNVERVVENDMEKEDPDRGDVVEYLAKAYLGQI